MTRLIIIALSLAALAGPASAACYADYKAKRDDPLRLHYGVVELRGPCDRGAAAGEIAERIAADDWELLNVVSVFEDAELEDKRESAGAYFLRY